MSRSILRWCVISLLLLGSNAYSAPASSLYSAGSIHDICSSFYHSLETGEPSPLGLLCTGYIQGVIDTVGRDRLCLPDKVSAADASLVVARFEKNQDNDQRPAAFLVMKALQQRYCTRTR